MPGQHPLELYRSIRRLHRRLPPGMRALGNSYILSEFRLHRKAEPSFIPTFLQEWTRYRDTLLSQIQPSLSSMERSDMFGKRLSSTELDGLSPQQLGQLYALREAAKGRNSGDVEVSGAQTVAAPSRTSLEKKE